MTKPIKGGLTHEGLALFRRAQKNSSHSRIRSYTLKDQYYNPEKLEALIQADVKEAQQQAILDLIRDEEISKCEELKEHIWSSGKEDFLCDADYDLVDTSEEGQAQQKLVINSETDFPALSELSSSRSSPGLFGAWKKPLEFNEGKQSEAGPGCSWCNVS